METRDSRYGPITRHFTPTPRQSQCLIRTAAEVVHGNAFSNGILSDRQIRLSKLAYGDLIAEMKADEQPAPSIETLRTDAVRLADEISDLSAAWDAVTEVDTNLGADAARAGQSLLSLADKLAAATGLWEPLRRALEHCSAELAEAVDFYDELDEHETDASIDIFDRLGPGIALVLRALQVPQNPTAPQRLTVAELAEQLRHFPQHYEVWVVVPDVPEGYVPLTSPPSLGEDADPRKGDPAHFIVLGSD